MAAEKIGHWRRKIDVINAKILKLLSQRAGYVQKIGQIKRKRHLKVYSQKRENQILRSLGSRNPGPFPSHSIRQIFKTIMRESRKLEKGL